MSSGKGLAAPLLVSFVMPALADLAVAATRVPGVSGCSQSCRFCPRL